MERINHDMLLRWIRHAQAALSVLVRDVAPHVTYVEPGVPESLAYHISEAEHTFALIESVLLDPRKDEIVDLQNDGSALREFYDFDENGKDLDFSEEMSHTGDSAAIDQIVESLDDDDVADIAEHFPEESEE